jgi:hypothetical protein
MKASVKMKTKCAILTGAAVLSGVLSQCHATITLGSAASFAVLGNTTVTSTGNTVLNGNLGLYPGTSITGFGPGIVNGTTYAGDTVAQQAANDALIAYGVLSGEPHGQNLSGQDLGGLTLAPGVYQFNSSAQLTGPLTLNANGDPNAQFVFQIESTLTTANSASVVLANGAQADNVFWQVGSSATVGGGSVIYGSIVADTSITLDTGASLGGNALALNGAVTLDDNTITIEAIPETNPSPVLAIFMALVGTSSCVGRYRRKKPGVFENGGNAV